jgi:large subunit ribosomal protein L15
MKLHDLRPAAGSRRERTRVGRGIAAGKGKTAGRGTKGQKSRAGASIPAWFEGGQTPIHIRVPKLRGFKNRFKIEYQVVNVGAIDEYASAGRFGVEAGKSDVPTINAEGLESAGLIGSAERPVKVLGHGDVSQKLFIAADKFSDSAKSKIEAAGGFVQVLAPEKSTDTGKVGKAGKAGGKADNSAAKADSEAAAESADSGASDESATQAPEPEPQPDVDASEAPESEGSATQAVDVDASSEADAEEPAQDAKPARRRSSKTTSEK